MKHLRPLLVSAVLLGCSCSVPLEPGAVPPAPFDPLFPILPPIEDANPDVRAERIFSVPTQLSVVRDSSRITVAVDSSHWENITVDVGYKMVTGYRRELSIWRGGERVAHSMGLTSGAPRWGTSIYSPQLHGIPVPGETYVVEVLIILFETDIPPQHMWRPQMGRYRELWSRALRSAEI